MPGLVELLLDLLLHDVPAGRSAHLSLGRSGLSRQVGEPTPDGHQVTASTELADGEVVRLSVQADLADDAATQAQLQRFLRPMVACVALERRLRARAAQAQEAVAVIERLAVLDLATGIVMARQDCDAGTARDLLTAWSAREGVQLQHLAPADVLERLTTTEPQV